MLEVVCWKWKPSRPYRSQFGPETVNVLRRMVQRHLKLPHRFSCITDDPRGIDPEVRVIPLWDDFASVPNPSNPRNPSCYRRLKMFSAEAKELIGEKIVSLDLDTVITGDLTPLFDHDYDFVIWGGQTVNPRGGPTYNWFNGSLMMLKAGSRTKVWETFDPHRSPALANAAGCRGSDQGWIAYCLGREEKTWGLQDGVLSYKNHVLTSGGKLPSHARIVAFHGQYDPWMPAVQARTPWVRAHYQ